MMLRTQLQVDKDQRSPRPLQGHLPTLTFWPNFAELRLECGRKRREGAFLADLRHLFGGSDFAKVPNTSGRSGVGLTLNLQRPFRGGGGTRLFFLFVFFFLFLVFFFFFFFFVVIYFFFFLFFFLFVLVFFFFAHGGKGVISSSLQSGASSESILLFLPMVGGESYPHLFKRDTCADAQGIGARKNDNRTTIVSPFGEPMLQRI